VARDTRILSTGDTRVISDTTTVRVLNEVPTNTPTALGTAAGTAATTRVITTTADAPAGSLIFVAAHYTTVIDTVTSVTDSAGNSYVVIENDAGTGAAVGTAYCKNCLFLASGSTITINFGGSVPSVAGAVCVQGVGTVNALDTSGHSSTGLAATSATSVATGTLALPSEIIFSVLGVAANISGVTNAGLTDTGASSSNNTTSGGSLALWYKNVTAPTSIAWAPTWTTAGNYASAVFSFKADPQTPARGQFDWPTPPRPRRLLPEIIWQDQGLSLILRLLPQTVTTTVYLPAGTTTWVVPAGITLLATVECWGPGGDAGGGLDTGGGGGAYSKAVNVDVTPGASIPVNIPTHNPGIGTDVWTWFNSITQQKAHGGKANGDGGFASQSIGNVVFDGGSGPRGGGGAAGSNGAGASGGNESGGFQSGGGGGGASNGGSVGGTGQSNPPGSGGNGGANSASQAGGAGGAAGLAGNNGVNAGSGGGGGGFNGTPGGNGADDKDNGGGGGGSTNGAAGSTRVGGNGGQPGGGAGLARSSNSSLAIGGDGQIKIVYTTSISNLPSPPPSPHGHPPHDKHQKQLGYTLIGLRQWIYQTNPNLFGKDKFYGGPGQAPDVPDWRVPPPARRALTLPDAQNQRAQYIVGKETLPEFMANLDKPFLPARRIERHRDPLNQRAENLVGKESLPKFAPTWEIPPRTPALRTLQTWMAQDDQRVLLIGQEKLPHFAAEWKIPARPVPAMELRGFIKDLDIQLIGQDVLPNLTFDWFVPRRQQPSIDLRTWIGEQIQTSGPTPPPVVILPAPPSGGIGMRRFDKKGRLRYPEPPQSPFEGYTTEQLQRIVAAELPQLAKALGLPAGEVDHTDVSRETLSPLPAFDLSRLRALEVGTGLLLAELRAAQAKQAVDDEEDDLIAMLLLFS
jgi:hypothetical protein